MHVLYRQKEIYHRRYQKDNNVISSGRWINRAQFFEDAAGRTPDMNRWDNLYGGYDGGSKSFSNIAQEALAHVQNIEEREKMIDNNVLVSDWSEAKEKMYQRSGQEEDITLLT